MRTPTGIRTESTRTPNASRAGALHSHIHIHSHRQFRAEGPIHRYGPNACESTHKLCPICERTRPRSAFYASRREADGLQHRCKECKAAYNRENAAQISERHRAYLQSQPGWSPRPPKLDPQRFRKYDLTEAQYDAMRADQGNACVICRRPEQHDRWLVVDHDHGTGLVRGLLCSRCNTGIGQLGDSVEGVEAAVLYLRAESMDGRSAAVTP